MIIRRYTPTSENRITEQKVDDTYLWLAYLGSSESCELHKVKGNKPTAIYFDLTITVNSINKMDISGNYLYCAVNSTNYIGVMIHKNNPLGTGNIDYISKPGTTTEEAVALALDGTYLYLLVPGEASGERAKVYKYNKTTLALDDTFNLQGTPSGDTRTYCRAMTIRSGYLWIFSYKSTAEWIKVDVSDGSYTFGNIN